MIAIVPENPLPSDLRRRNYPWSQGLLQLMCGAVGKGPAEPSPLVPGLGSRVGLVSMTPVWIYHSGGWIALESCLQNVGTICVGNVCDSHYPKIQPTVVDETNLVRLEPGACQRYVHEVLVVFPLQRRYLRVIEFQPAIYSMKVVTEASQPAGFKMGKDRGYILENRGSDADGILGPSYCNSKQPACMSVWGSPEFQEVTRLPISLIIV